jgi:hypothetical protein
MDWLREQRRATQMSTEPRMQSDLERLKQVLGDTPWSREFHEGYVREVELHRQEEDVFIRLAFQDANTGGAFGRGDTHITSVYSEFYDQPLDVNQKREVRLWWHDKVRREVEKITDLGERLARARRALTLRAEPSASLRTNLAHGSGTATEYKVSGLMLGEEITIRRFGDVWKFQRVNNGVSEPWLGEFLTAEDALATLSLLH